MISVLSQLTKTFDPRLQLLVSLYIKTLPIGGRDVAPERDDGEFVFVDLMKLDIFPLLFLSLHFFSSFEVSNHHYFQLS